MTASARPADSGTPAARATRPTVPHVPARRAVRPPTELPDAVRAQIAAAADLLRADAAAAGMDAADVDAAVLTAVLAYRFARVHAFIGLLVEREVRERLHLRRTPPSRPGVLPSTVHRA